MIFSTSNNLRNLLGKIFIYIVLVGAIIATILPMLNGILISIKHPVDAFAIPPKFIFSPTLDYHRKIWLEDNFLHYTKNSFIIVFFSIIISVPMACLAGYAFARYKGKGSLIGLILLLVIRCFPNMVMILPFFMISIRLGIHDTKLLMVIVMVAFNQPFSIWLMRGFFFDIPKELEDSAMIDGCSRFGAYLRIILPAASSGIATTIIFSFLTTYHDLMFAVILTGTNTATIPVAISKYGQELVKYWSNTAAGVTASVIPVFLLFIFLQKPLLRGFSSSGVIK